jgi:hypothetical protein
MSTDKVTMRHSAVLFIILIICGGTAQAQKVEIGGGGGPTAYKGDLQPKFRLFNPGIAGNAFFRYNFDRVISFKANITYGNVRGNDTRSGNPYLKERAFAFNHSVLDYLLQVEYNFLNFRTHTGRYEHDWTPYVFGGAGFSQNLKKEFSYGGVTQNLTNERKPAVVIPFGIGIKKIIGPRLNLSAEFSTKAFLSKSKGADFDGLNGLNPESPTNKYESLGLLSSSLPEYEYLNIPNTQQKDKYFHLSVTLSYLIYRVKCNDPNSKFSFF